MPYRSVEEQRQHISSVLEYFDQYKEEIERVRELENHTIPGEAPVGYNTGKALCGYQGLLDAYAVLDEKLTDQQRAKIDKLSQILAQLEEDKVGFADPAFQTDRYSTGKWRELERTGEIYIPSGYVGHFNITKIAKIEKGYSRTLYDAGAEAAIVRYEGNLPFANAVRENAVAKENVHDLIGEIVIKAKAPFGSDAYNVAQIKIDGMLGEEMRTVEDLKQGKSNCSTRSQRILMRDMLQDDALWEKIYEFISANAGPGTRKIRSDLLDKYSSLERQEEDERFLRLPLSDAILQKFTAGEMHRDRAVDGAGIGFTGTASDLSDMEKLLTQDGIATSYRRFRSGDSRGRYYLRVNADSMPQLYEASPAWVKKNWEKLPPLPKAVKPRPHEREWPEALQQPSADASGEGSFARRTALPDAGVSKPGR